MTAGNELAQDGSVTSTTTLLVSGDDILENCGRIVNGIEHGQGNGLLVYKRLGDVSQDTFESTRDAVQVPVVDKKTQVAIDTVEQDVGVCALTRFEKERRVVGRILVDNGKQAVKVVVQSVAGVKVGFGVEQGGLAHGDRHTIFHFRVVLVDFERDFEGGEVDIVAKVR